MPSSRYDDTRPLTAVEAKTLQERMEGAERSLLSDIAMASKDENVRQKVDELLAITKLVHDDELNEALATYKERQRRKIIFSRRSSEMYPKFTFSSPDEFPYGPSHAFGGRGRKR